jgi:hypothetical protein
MLKTSSDRDPKYKNINSKEEERKMERIFITHLMSHLGLILDRMNEVTTYNTLMR